MQALTYFAAMATLAAALILAQNTVSRSRPDDQARPSAQAQDSAKSAVSPPQHLHNGNAPAPSDIQPKVKLMPRGQRSAKAGAAIPAYVNQTPAQRAVATHTPDPGTRMNPAALETGEGAASPAHAPGEK